MWDLLLSGAIKCSPHFAARKVFMHLPIKDVGALSFWSGLGHTWLQSSTEAEHQLASEQTEISTSEGFCGMKPSITRNVMGYRDPFQPQ